MPPPAGYALLERSRGDTVSLEQIATDFGITVDGKIPNDRTPFNYYESKFRSILGSRAQQDYDQHCKVFEKIERYKKHSIRHSVSGSDYHDYEAYVRDMVSFPGSGFGRSDLPDRKWFLRCIALPEKAEEFAKRATATPTTPPTPQSEPQPTAPPRPPSVTHQAAEAPRPIDPTSWFGLDWISQHELAAVLGVVGLLAVAVILGATLCRVRVPPALTEVPVAPVAPPVERVVERVVEKIVYVERPAPPPAVPAPLHPLLAGPERVIRISLGFHAEPLLHTRTIITRDGASILLSRLELEGDFHYRFFLDHPETRLPGPKTLGEVADFTPSAPDKTRFVVKREQRFDEIYETGGDELLLKLKETLLKRMRKLAEDNQTPRSDPWTKTSYEHTLTVARWLGHDEAQTREILDNYFGGVRS